MKAFRKGLALFLAIVLIINILPMSAAAAFVRESVGEEIALSNDFIKLTVNSKNGRFSIQTLEGQSVRKTDDNSFLSFIGGLFGDGLGDSDTSFTTFRINGTDYIFGNKYTIPEKGVTSDIGETKVLTTSEFPSIPDGCQAVVTPWTVEGVTVTQILLLYPEEDKQNSGNVQIFYQVQNMSGAEVNVGARILLDTMLGANDGPEFQIGTISSNTLRVERMLSKDPVNDQGVALENKNYWTMPGYWVMRDTLDASNPLATNVIAYGYTDIATYRPLDYMIVSHWNKLANEKFEEFEDYKAVPAEMTEAAAEVSRTQRLAEKAAAIAEQKENEAQTKEEAAVGAEEGSKADLDAKKAREDANKVKAAADKAAAAAETAKAALAAIGREQKGSSIIDPNLDFTDDKNDYGSADSAVAFYWSGEGSAAKLANGAVMQLGTVYGLGEIIEPTSVLAISFPDPVTQVEINPNNQDTYKNFGVFDINVEIENLAKYDMKHDRVDISMTLEKGLRFVKRDAAGNILRDETGAPLTSYGSTQTVTFEKALTPEQAEKGEKNPILPGEKFAATFTVMATGKPWPTTRQYMVTATSPQLEQEFEDKFGNEAGEDVKALYNSSRANFIYLPSVGSGTPTYSTSVSPEECFTKDPKYITVNLTNVEAYNPGSSVRGQESRPNFNLYIEEIVTGKRYQVDVTDNVQFIPTDDGLTGDMRISYTNGTLVDADGVPLQTDLGYELPVGEYRVAIDYISTDEDENGMLDMATEQTFLVTENEEARIRQPGVLAVVKETIDFDDSEIMQKINDLVAEVQAAIEELQGIAEKLESTDWSSAIYDEVIDFAKELISPVTKIYDDFEKLTDFTNIEADMRALSGNFDELADIDFSSIRDFNLGKALKGVNVDISLSDEFKKQFDIESLLLGPLGLQGITELAEGGVDGVYDSIKNYGKNALAPITSIYEQIADLSDFSSLSNNEIEKLKSSFAELKDVDFSSLKNFNFDVSIGLNTGKLEEQFKKIIDIDSILSGPLGADGVGGIFDSITSYGEDLIKPLTNLYDDILELADFSSLTDGEIAELKSAYKDLEDVDFASLKNLDLGKIISGAEINVKLNDKFKALVDIETLLKGPFGGDNVGEDIFAWLQGYAKKVAAPVLSIYDDLADLTDFSNIESEMEELSKSYKELQGVDFSSIEDFDFSKAISGIADSVDVNISLSENFKKAFDYEALLEGPFGGKGIEGFYDKIEAYGRKVISPLTNIVEQIEQLADFSNIGADMSRLSKSFDELADVDFSCLENFEFTEAIKAVVGSSTFNADLSEAFRAKFDYEAILKGPVDGSGNFSTEQITPWLEKISTALNEGKEIYNLCKDAYQSKDPMTCAKTLLGLINKYLNINISIDFGAALTKANKEAAAETYTQAEKLALAVIAMYTKMHDIYNGLETKYNQANSIYQQVFEIKDKVVSFVNKLSHGDLSALLSAGKDMLQFVLGEWLDPVYNAIDSAKELYKIGEKAYSGKLSIKEGAQLLMDFYEKYLDVSVSADFTAIGDDNKAALSETAEQAKKMGLVFMAMYAKMQNIYSSIAEKVDRANEIYTQAKDLVNTVINVGSSLLNGDFSDLTKILSSAGKDLFETVLKAWLDPVMDTIDSAKDIYSIAQKAFSGNLSAKEGARLLMGFYESYLDVDVKADLSGLKTAAAGTYDDAQKVAAAFMVMYGRLQNIYSSLGNKVERATELYNKAKEIINTVVKLVKAIGSGDLSQIVDKILEMGTDIVSTVVNSWLGQVQGAIDSVKELYSIGQHAYKGDLSLKDGAQLLVDFYENYLDVSVTADLKGVKDASSQARKVADAFMVMYAQMRSIYSNISTKVDAATGVYNQAKSIINTVIKLVSDPMAAVNDIVNAGKDAIFDLLNTYIDKINDMIDSVKSIYEIGKKAYEGKIDIKEGAELLIGFCEKYLNISITADLDAIGEENKKAASDTLEQGKKVALAFMAMFARMKNIYTSLNSKYSELTGIYDEMMEIVDTVMSLFTDPAKGAYALIDLVKKRIMDKLDGLGMYKDMFMQILDVIGNFDSFDPSTLVDEAMNFAVTTARVKADQALYSTIYGMLVTAATKLDPNSDYEWSPGDLKKSLPTYRLMTFADEAELKEYQDKIAEQNKKKKAAEKTEKDKAQVGNDGVMVKITGIIHQLGNGENVTDYIVDTSSEPAIINDTVAFKGSDLVITQGKLKISFGDIATIDAGEYISKAQSIYGSETPLFDTLIVSGTGQLYIEGSGFVFHEGEWSLDFYNGFDKILDPVKVEGEEKKNNASEESGALNETAAWAIGALNDMFNPLKALAITDVYFNRHTLFSAPSFSVAGFGLKFDNYLLRSSEVCFGGHIDFKIVKGEIQNVFFNSEGLQSIEADLKFDLGGDLGLLQKGESAGGDLIIHYYDPDYLASFKERGYEPPEEKYGLTFNAKLKSVGGVGVELAFKRVADGRILPDIIAFKAAPPPPGIMVYSSLYLTEIRGAIRELADTIAGGSSTVPLTIEAGVDLQFGQAPAVFDGKIDMILKMTGIEFNGKLNYKGKPMITQAQIKAQWVTPWFVSASMEMDVLGLNIIIGKARLFIGQNIEKDRIDFEGFVSAALQIPSSIPVVGGFQLGQVSFGLNNDKIWGSASVGVTPIAVSVGITYYWNGGIEFGTCGEDLPEAYTYILLERPEEEPVLVAIGSGMRTEATSWVNENTIHEIEYHAVGDGVSYLDNGQNDIGIGGIEVSNEGKTHSIPVANVAEDRDALIEIEYYGEEKSAAELQSMLTLTNGNGGNYTIKIGDMNNPKPGDSAFKQELVTEDQVNRHLVYVMVPHGYLTTQPFVLTSTERVQTKLLSTPIASSLSSVTFDENGSTSYKATVNVADRHDGDTVSLYLTKEAIDSTPRQVEAKDDEGNTIYIKNEDGTVKLDANNKPVPLMVDEDKDPGVLIFEGIPVPANGTVIQAFDLSDIDNDGNIDYAVPGLGDIRELLESGNYYLRAALKSDTAFSAMTSSNYIEITDPKAPNPASGVTLSNAGNGYFNMSFIPGSDLASNELTGYRVDFYDNQGNLYSNYNGLIFDKSDLDQNYTDGNGNYVIRLGGWTVTGGEGTDEKPYTYSGLEAGKVYTAKVYAASQTPDGNYHYASPAESALTVLPVPQYVYFTSISADSGTMGFKTIEGDNGETITTTSRHLVTNQAAPELTLATNYGAAVEAYNGDTLVGTMDSFGKLKLTGLVTDGDYAVELRAKNNSTGDLSVTVLYVTIDRIEPAILITSPSGESVNFNSFQITGITEPGSTITANGQPLTVAADGSFAGNITLSIALASEKIRIEAKDKAGNTNVAIVSVTNGAFASPVGLNVVRAGTMRPNTSQQVQVFLKYADGKDPSGVQKYRSVAVPSEDRNRLSYDIVQGDAISVNSNQFSAIREGASLVRVSYKVNETLTLSTMVAVLVDEKAKDPGVIDDTYPKEGGTGGRSGGDSSGASGDVVVNGKSQTVTLDDSGRSIVKISDKDDIDTTQTLKVTNLTHDASAYILEVDSSVAKELSGENGAGVSFTGGSAQIDLPGENLTGEDLSITISNPDYTQQKKSRALAEELNASVVTPGVNVKLSGVEIEPGDRVLTRIELPAGAKVSDITALVYTDENGNYTPIPWKLDIAGNTAYVKCYLPGSGTIVPMNCDVVFSDVKSDYWGADAIRQAAGQMLIRGYENGTFKPNAQITRAEYATVMLRAAGLMTQPGADINYKDVQVGDWYYDVVSIATDLGIMTGYADGSARSNNSITRAESMVIVSRLLKLEKLGEELSEEDVESILAGFLDNDKIPDWARKDIALCVKSSIIVGSNGEIKAQDPLTRVQAAIISSRLSAAIAATM